MIIDLLLTKGAVITMNQQRALIEDGAVAVDKGRILAVGTTESITAEYQGSKTIDCNGKIVLPGLIDAHGHAGHSLVKTIGSDSPTVWMKIITPVYMHYTTDDYWYVDGLLSAVERLRFGVTCGMSVMGSMPRSDDPIFAINHARAYSEVGIREIVAVGPCALPWPHKFSRWVDGKRIERDVTFDEALAGAEEAIESWNHGAEDRIRVFITPFTIIPSLPTWGPSPPDIATTLTAHDREQSRRIREIASKYNTRIHSDAFGGQIKLAALDENGLLGPDVLLQHCHGLSIEEIGILAETDTRIGHSPGPSTYRCPVPELMQAGVTVAVTTDGTSPRVSFDLLQAIRKAQLLHQTHFGDRFYLPPGKLLEMITIDAAKAIGWEDEIGSLEVGKKADIAIINMRKPHLTPNIMFAHRVVYEAVGNDVETVIVDGMVIMEDNKILTVDEMEILDQAQQECLATIERAGLQSHIGPPSWGAPYHTFDQPVELTE